MVAVPQWMVPWQGTPPVQARDVWSLLSPELRERCTATSWVSACYRRLAMGSADAVHILMSINVSTIGRALLAGRALGAVVQC